MTEKQLFLYHTLTAIGATVICILCIATENYLLAMVNAWLVFINTFYAGRNRT